MSDPDSGEAPTGHFDPGVLAIALGLLALAALVAYDASQLPAAATYARIGPQAAPYWIAAGLAGCGVLTVVAALRGSFPAREPDHWQPVAWIVGGLLFQIAAVGLGLGFIPATAVLFAATSRAFGRRAFATDLAIGLSIGIGLYLLFTKVLTLSLPQGPLERLL
jgi:putative tricarboxylic transport membrane protein